MHLDKKSFIQSSRWRVALKTENFQEATWILSNTNDDLENCIKEDWTVRIVKTI